MGDERRQPAPDVVREPSGSLVLRGSLPLGRLQELFGVEWDESLENEGATTIAGLMNRVAGHVPEAGETLEFGGILFDIVEANQRKVLRVRARRNPQVSARVGEMCIRDRPYARSARLPAWTSPRWAFR